MQTTPTMNRTRGRVNPGLGFPGAANVEVRPLDPIVPGDAFVVTTATAANEANGLTGTIPEGGLQALDYIVALAGGNLGEWSGWVYVPAAPLPDLYGVGLLPGMANAVVVGPRG